MFVQVDELIRQLVIFDNEFLFVNILAAYAVAELDATVSRAACLASGASKRAITPAKHLPLAINLAEDRKCPHPVGGPLRVLPVVAFLDVVVAAGAATGHGERPRLHGPGCRFSQIPK